MEDKRTVAEIKHNISLIDICNERLHVLELQEAQQGIHVAPCVITEIKQIKQIKQRIEILEQKIEVMYEVENLYVEAGQIIDRSKALLLDSMSMLKADEYDLIDKAINTNAQAIDSITEVQVIMNNIGELMKKYRSM
jgi:hypothetical protein